MVFLRKLEVQNILVLQLIYGAKRIFIEERYIFGEVLNFSSESELFKLCDVVKLLYSCENKIRVILLNQ